MKVPKRPAFNQRKKKKAVLRSGKARRLPRTSSHHSNIPALHHSSSSIWEARYQSKDMPWEKGEASPGLVDFLEAHPGLPRGKVCVPGCGTGHDVRAWANAGFQA